MLGTTFFGRPNLFFLIYFTYFSGQIQYSPLIDNNIYNETLILQRLHEGSNDAFRTVFEWLVAPLHYYAMQLTNNEEEAEDMVSMAFHKLWEGSKEFNSLKALRSYMYTIIRRQCIDMVRHRKVVKEVHARLSLEDLSDEGRGEAQFLQTELIRIIYDEIERLPHKYRNILKLSFIEEKTTSEISAQLGISEGHLRADRSRALVLLRNSLKNKKILHLALLLYTLWQKQA